MVWMWSAAQFCFSDILFISSTLLWTVAFIQWNHFGEQGTLIYSQNSLIFVRPRETNPFLASPSGVVEFPNVLSLVDLGGECWRLRWQRYPDSPRSTPYKNQGKKTIIAMGVNSQQSFHFLILGNGVLFFFFMFFLVFFRGFLLLANVTLR